MSKTRDVLPIDSTTFSRLQQSSGDQSRREFFVFVFFLFFKPAGDPSSATLVPDLANQVWPFKSALFKTSQPGKRSSLTREASATERHGNDRLSKRAVHKVCARRRKNMLIWLSEVVAFVVLSPRVTCLEPSPYGQVPPAFPSDFWSHLLNFL